MTTEIKCREYARECTCRAELVTNAELRERLLNIAHIWTKRANQCLDAKPHDPEGLGPGKQEP